MMLIEKKLWKVFSEFIRLRDAMPQTGMCKCFTCNVIKFWREMDCGHGVPRQHQGTKYSETNNHSQCKNCNGFQGGNQAEYAKQVDRKYGTGTWSKLLVASRQVTKRTRVDFEIMFNFYSKEVARLKKEKNL